MFEPGLRNTGSDLGDNVGNPIAMLKAAADMLHYLKLHGHAANIEQAVTKTVEEDKVFTKGMNC